MKRKTLLSLFLSVVLVLAFYGLGWAPGGSPEPGPAGVCPFEQGEDLPPPKSGRFIFGTFTVSQDTNEDQCTEDMAYVIHLALRQGSQVHLFNFRESQGCEPGLEEPCVGSVNCDYVLTDFTASDLKDLMEWTPCNNGIGLAFGFSPCEYVPVIKRVRILKRENEGLQSEMIKGSIVIRLVPGDYCSQ